MESYDGKRMSPRQNKGQRPKYHSDEYKGDMGKKSGSVAQKRHNMAGKSKQPMGSKATVGLKGKPLVLGTSSESDDASDDDDEDTSEDERPKKKSRLYANPKRMSSKGIANTSPVIMQRGGKATAVTEKMTYKSDRYSSSEDEATRRAEGSKRCEKVGNERTIDDLMKLIEDRESTIRSLELEIAKTKLTSRMNKKKVREELKWTGEETNFSETVSNFCRAFLFPRTKFLNDGWKNYLPDDRDSLYAICMRRLKIPEGSDPEDIWERVIVPTIMRKYQHLKCNLNNEIKSIYLSMTKNMSCCLFPVNCTDITMIRSLQPTEDPRMVNPDKLSKGVDEYFDVGNESAVFEFVCTYVRRIASDASWRKKMKMYPGTPVFNMITPSDIAYVLSIIKNGKESWDQTKRLESTPGTRPEKKIQPLFSRGEGRKRVSGQTVWNNTGLEFFYTTEKIWREVYNSKRYSKLINKWEKWEATDKSKKDPIRTIWEDEEEEEKKKKSDVNSHTKKEWWEQNQGYSENLGLAMEIKWDNDEGEESSDPDEKHEEKGEQGEQDEQGEDNIMRGKEKKTETVGEGKRRSNRSK